jgi:hypothetical protein
LRWNASIGKAHSSFRQHLRKPSGADDSLLAAPCLLLDVAADVSSTAMKSFRVSQFDQHRHHGTSRILFRMQVGDKRISCTSISQCRITIAEEAVRPRSQTPPDRD